jgi:hypothetical protein
MKSTTMTEFLDRANELLPIFAGPRLKQTA